MVDAGYLCFGLALAASIREHAPEWTLHVVCLDDRASELLGALELEAVELIRLEELERAEPGLTVAREVRPPHDFMMLVKSLALRHVLDGPGDAAAVSWLDADAMCFDSLDPLLEELGDGSVLVVPQGVPPAFRWIERRTGIYMGGLVSFRGDDEGRRALGWWADRCLVGGCPRQPDQHRFADQKYLQELPRRFDGVSVARSPALRLAPFNLECHRLTPGPDGPLVDGDRVVLYQYTGFNELSDGSYEASYPPWRIGAEARALLYEPYRERVRRARRRVRAVDPGFDAGIIPPRSLAERAVGAGSRAKGTLLRGRHRLAALAGPLSRGRRAPRDPHRPSAPGS